MEIKIDEKQTLFPYKNWMNKKLVIQNSFSPILLLLFTVSFLSVILRGSKLLSSVDWISAMFLSKFLIVTFVSSLIECQARSSFQKVKNITVIEGEDDFLDCLKESKDYNPSSIEWFYGKEKV